MKKLIERMSTKANMNENNYLQTKTNYSYEINLHPREPQIAIGKVTDVMILHGFLSSSPSVQDLPFYK